MKERSTVFAPKNLELESVLSANPPEFNFHIDKFKYILDLLVSIPSMNKEISDNAEFVPINSRKLQSVIHDYKKYLDYLIKQEIIETDNQYILNVKSKGYRYTKQYRAECVFHCISKKAFIKSGKFRSNYQNGKVKKYNHLKNWFNRSLFINLDLAMDYLKQQLGMNMIRGDENAIEKYNYSCLNVYRIANREYYFHVDNNVGRLHTNLTNLKSELRNLITYDGEQLVSVDIKSSQLSLSLALLNTEFYSNSTDGADLFNVNNITQSKSLINYLQSPTTINTITSYIMLVNSSETHDSKGFKQYSKVVQEGYIYEYIQKGLEAATGSKIPTRKEVKEVVFTALFTDNRYIGQDGAKPKRIFKSLFPEVYKLLAIIKRKDSTILPRLLQKMESKLMLDRVAKQISKDFPYLPIYTIHDSIVCPVGYEGYVADVIRFYFNESIGIEPQVKFEYWADDNLKMN